MPARPRPGPRYTLEPNAIEWIAGRNPQFRRPERRPDHTRRRARGWSANYSAIAHAAGLTPATLNRVVHGHLPLSAEVMAGLVYVSGARRHTAERKMFKLDLPDVSVLAAAA